MLKVGSCFTGIGAWEKGLSDLGIEHDVKWYFEIDEYASCAYSAIHAVPEENNQWDITKADLSKLEEIDLLTYSPPCQSFSVAGKQGGTEDKRGQLFFYVLPIIEKTKPKICIMENVKGLTNKKFKEIFETMLSELEMLGYNNYWKILNAKDFGIPQNRERVFIVSIKKEIDTGYDFPKGFDNGIRLKDMLEDVVDEKYYISDEKARYILNRPKNYECKINPEISNCLRTNYGHASANESYVQEQTIPVLTPDRTEKRQNGRRFKEDGEPMFTLTGQDRHGVMETKRIGGIFDGKTKHQAGSVWDTEALCPTLDTAQGGWRQPCIVEPKILDDTKSERFGGGKTFDICPCLRESRHGHKVLNPGHRIRKLTPLECFRLMGFKDTDYYKAKTALEKRFYNGKDKSNSQMYKLAGNSVVVDVIIALYKQLDWGCFK